MCYLRIIFSDIVFAHGRIIGCILLVNITVYCILYCCFSGRFKIELWNKLENLAFGSDPRVTVCCVTSDVWCCTFWIAFYFDVYILLSETSGCCGAVPRSRKAGRRKKQAFWIFLMFVCDWAWFEWYIFGGLWKGITCQSLWISIPTGPHPMILQAIIGVIYI